MRFALVALATVPLLACSILAGLDKDFERVECLHDCDGGGLESGADATDATFADAPVDLADAKADADADASVDPCGYVDVTDPTVVNNPDYAGFPMPNAQGANIITNVIEGDVIHDLVTDLRWQREAAPTKMTAADGALYCAGLTDGGTPWRMPSRVELASLQRYNPLFDVNGNYVQPCVAAEYIPSGAFIFSYFMSSTAVPKPTSQHFAFHQGSCGAAELAGTASIRCVQGTPPKPHFQVSEKCNSVRDVNARLEWERDIRTTEYSVETDAGTVIEVAANICASVATTRGTSGWKVPTANEAYSIFDSTRLDPAMSPVLFPNTPVAGKLMTSSRRYRYDIIDALDLTNGVESGANLSEKILLRCVRNLPK